MNPIHPAQPRRPLNLRRKARRLGNFPRALQEFVREPRWRSGEFYEGIREMRDRYNASLNLTAFEYKLFSQNGEDGVIAEIVRRLGENCPPFFVEFGMGRGWKGNCVVLADLVGWSGAFIEVRADEFADLERKYGWNRRIRLANSLVTRANINSLFADLGVPQGFGLLSIDVDGNDYYLWEALSESYQPQVVVIEYNGSLPLDKRVVQAYSEAAAWDGTNHFGASIPALVELASRKGYRLIHTDVTGVNAFFIRNEHESPFPGAGDVPLHPANYEMRGHGHPPGAGSWVYLDDDGRP